MRPERLTTSVAVPAFLEEDSNGWLVTFSDLVLQLFAFVLVVAALGAASGGRRAAEHEPPALRLAIEEPASVPSRAPDALSLARFDDLPPPAPVEPAVAVPAPVVATAPAEAMLPAPLAPAALDAVVVAPPTAPASNLAAELESFVRAEGLADAVQVAVNGGGVTLTISDTIGFDSGSAELLADATPVLAEVRALVVARPDLVVEVAGHSDDRPVHAGVFPSNLELSLARAARVARELAAGEPGLAARVFASGYGPQRPVASNEDAEGRARNRRVELRLVSGRDAALDPPLARPPRSAR